MPIGIQLEFPGGTQEQYEAIRRHSDGDTGAVPTGLVLHVSGPMENGWRVVAVWETRVAFQAFASGPLHRLTEEAGPIGEASGPIVTEFAVHDLLIA
jgi:hypothetical protein